MAITANKLLGKKEKGGALAVIPKSPLVASPGGELAKIPEKPQEPQEDVVYTIRTKVIEIDKLLKGTFVEKKKRQKDEKTEKENEKRKKTESKLEDDATDSDDEEENKLKMPRLSFLDGIKKFISNVLLGWLTFKLIKHLPTIVKFLKPIAAIAGFFIKWGGKFLDGVVTFIDWGYKALDATKGWIGDKFGEDAANKFESFMGNLTKMFNGIVLLGMGIAKMAMSGRPKGPKGPKSKWRKALEKRWKKSRVGKFFRNNAAARKKLIRKITRPVRRVTRALKPKNIVKNLQKTKLGQKVTKRFAKASQQVDEIIKDPKKALKNLKKTEIGKKVTKTTKTITDAVKDPKKALKNLQKTEIGKKVTNIAKKADPRKWKMPKLKTPGWMKSAGAAIQKKFTSASAWIKSIPAKTRQMWDDVAKKVGPYIDEMGEGIGKIGKSIGAQWDEATKNMKPQKVIDDLMVKIRPAIDDVLKKSPILSKLTKGLNPQSVQGLLTKAAKNPALQKLINTLKANKGASKGLGPVDKIITALMTLWDYTMGREAPINAILKGLGGLFGYGVGFSAASAVPVLGQSGIFNFMGGMAGGIAGEWLAMKTAKVLAGTPLGDIDDPIMGPKDIEAGLPARKLVRDPDGLIDHMLAGPKVKDEGGEGGKRTTTTIDRSNQPGTADLLESGKRGDIETALFNMRSSAAQGSGSDWVGNEKYAGDVDLIMKHGLENVIIESGRVTLKEAYKASLKGNAENIVPLDVNSVKKKTDDVSVSASYEDDSGDIIVVEKGSQEEGTPEIKPKETLTPIAVGGGGGSDDMGDRLYKGG